MGDDYSLLVVGGASFCVKTRIIAVAHHWLVFLKTGCIPVDRSAGMRALREMRAAGQDLAKRERSMLIFPQGTRVAPGVEQPYEIEFFRCMRLLASRWCRLHLIPAMYGRATAG